MISLRDPSSDWVQEVSGYGRDNLALNQSIIAHDKLWISGSHVDTPESGVRYIYGLSLRDGSVQTTIDVTGLGGNQYGNGDKNVDQNGYIWLDGPRGSSTTSKANQVIDVINNTLITRVGTQTSGNYGGWIRVFDPNNNVIWAYRNATTLQAISTVSYTESYSISDRADGGFTVDYDKNEVWVCNNTANTIKRYNATTGALNGTITSSHTMYSNSVEYIPDKNYMLVSDNTDIQIWSTLDYSLVGTITTTGNESIYPRHYHLPTDSILVVHENYDTGFYTLRSYSLTSPFNYTTFELNLLPNTDPFGNDQLVHGAVAVGSDGSIYLGVDKYDSGTSSYINYFYKIAYNQVCLNPVPQEDKVIILPSNEDTSSDYSNVNNFDVFNRELILDMTLMAFSVYDISHSKDAGSPFVRDYLFVPPYTLETTLEDIYRGTDLVTDGAGVTLTITGGSKVNTRTTDERQERFKFLATKETFISLVEYNSYSFKDWVSVDGVGLDFNSYLLTGYELTGEMMRQKQAIYLKLYFDRTEDSYTLDDAGNVILAHQSGCKVQSQWNWNNSFEQGKWGIPFQGYRLLRTQPTNPSVGDVFNYAERVVVTKNKLRGRGHCVSLLFVSDSGKDTKLLGWGMNMTGNNSV